MGAGNGTAIELRNITKSFGERAVIRGVSLGIREGEIFVIIGMSGTGKTVTLRHIAGLIDPDEGEVLVGGMVMSGARDSVREGIRRRMGMVFQSGALINWLSVRDNVALPLVEARAHTRGEIDRLVDEKLELLNLGGAGDKMPGDISGGMKKRVCLARVLVRNPDIILYDEPTSGLDPVMSSVIDELVVRMKADLGVTQVVVTHDMDSAYRIADRIAVLYEGSIILCGPPEEIRNSADPVVRQFVTGSLEGPIHVA